MLRVAIKDVHCFNCFKLDCLPLIKCIHIVDSILISILPKQWDSNTIVMLCEELQTVD